MGYIASGSSNRFSNGIIIAGGTISSVSNGNIQILPNGTGYTKIGDAGNPGWWGSAANDDLYVSGKLEVSGVTNFGTTVYFRGNNNVCDVNRELNFDATNSSISVKTSTTPAQMIIGVHTNKAIIICDQADATGNWAYAAQTNPTLCIRSNTAAATATDQYVSLAHNTADAEMLTGKGNIIFTVQSAASTLTGNSQVSMSLDQTEHHLVFTVKYSDGTSKTGIVELS